MKRTRTTHTPQRYIGIPREYYIVDEGRVSHVSLDEIEQYHRDHGYRYGTEWVVCHCHSAAEAMRLTTLYDSGHIAPGDTIDDVAALESDDPASLAERIAAVYSEGQDWGDDRLITLSDLCEYLSVRGV